MCKDGELIGGLIGIKGIGPKMAEDTMNRRENSQPLTPSRQDRLLNEEKHHTTIYLSVKGGLVI